MPATRERTPLIENVLPERPACPACGARMRLARIEPHPSEGPRVDLRSYECDCGHALSETVRLGG